MSKELDDITKENITYFLKKMFSLSDSDKVTEFYEMACTYFDTYIEPCGIRTCIVYCKYPYYDERIKKATLNLSYADYREIDNFIFEAYFFWERYKSMHKRPTNDRYVIDMQRS